MSLTEILLSIAFPLLISVGLTLATAAMSPTEFWIARIAFIIAALDVSGLVVWWLYTSGMSWWTRLTGFAIAGGTIIALPIILRWIDSKQADAVAATHHPDVTLRFVYPQSPALQLMNISDKTAREIKYTVIAWNIDLPDRLDPLPIPVSTFDFLNAGQISGSEGIFSSPPVASLVKPGNRLFGSASVICPECSRGRTFIVSIVWGERGWFAELPNDTSGDLILPGTPVTRNTMMRYFNELPKTIPETSRIPIGEP